MSGEFSPDWLTLREPADAEARSGELAGRVRDRIAGPLTIRDLGCGTGSMGRWLAPRLPGPQHWVLTDRDPELLAHAAASLPAGAADGSPVTVETRTGDVTALTADDLVATSLVTCSALLDLLTAGEVAGIAAACAGAGSTALFTLSVVGEVGFDPVDEFDPDVTAAFNAHQRRVVGGRRLLGPDAGVAAAAAFDAAGATVTLRPSPWRLGPDRAGLAAEWLAGWVGAAAEQLPGLDLSGYLRRRSAGHQLITVGHVDLLAEFD